jgi:MIF4G like
MISRVGEFVAPSTDADFQQEPDSSNNNLRPVVMATANNIAKLTQVISKPSNVATFLKFIPPPPPKKPEDTGFGFTRPPPKPEDQAGPMAHLIVSCAATLPLQTPCYAALTLSVHAYSKDHDDYAGFANRCVVYTLQRLSYDMDTLFLATTTGGRVAGEIQRPKIACRIKLLLRYLALLGKLNIIQAQDHDAEDNNNDSTIKASPEQFDNNDNNNNDSTTTSMSNTSFSLLGFLLKLVEAAVAAAPTEDAFATMSSSNAAASLVLAYFVLSTIPYLVSFLSVDIIQEQLLDPLQILLGSYASSFTPGVGMTAILLKEEQLEVTEEEDEEEEEDDDDDEEASEVICDNLQDLYRSVQLLLTEHNKHNHNQISRFALLTDEPWKGISGPAPAEEASAMDTATNENENEIKTEPASEAPANPGEPMALVGPLIYADAPLRLQLPLGGFQSLAVLSGTTTTSNNGELEEEEAAAPKIQAFPLEMVVFGRLPIFGAPRAAAGGALEEGDMEEEDAPVNEHVAAYSSQFGILDRCFLADAIRDLLCCHESAVSATGLERGNAKSVAEQLWSLGHVFASADTPSHDPATNGEGLAASTPAAPIGLEYGILESLLSLILQSSSNSTFRQVYLSRILLELTRLQPALVSPALALAASNLFQDYVPSLVPAARHNLSCWLAFHLVNTDYQWPSAYWAHYQSYVGDGKNLKSRGIIVKSALHSLMENVHDAGVLVKDCIPRECTGLLSQIVCPLPTSDANDEGSSMNATEKDIRRRVWDDDEHPESLRNYLVGDELSEALASDALDANSSPNRMWCRSGILLRTMLKPLEREHQRLLNTVERAQKDMIKAEGEEDEIAMEEDEELSEDTLAVVQEVLLRHGPTLAAAIQKDREVLGQVLEGPEKESDLVMACEPYLLSILGTKGCYSRSTTEGCLSCLLQQSSVLSSLGVLRWTLGELASTDSNDKPALVERWWEFATDAIRSELTKANERENGPSASEEGGMVIDRTGDGGAESDTGAPNTRSNTSSSKTLATIDSIGPLLDYIVRRACTLLTEKPDEPNRGSKLKPEQVDLVEGVKACVRAAHGLCMSELRRSNENESGVSEREIKDSLAQSSATGWKLAGVCDEFSSHAVAVLRDSLATV